jgi:GST-like protein
MIDFYYWPTPNGWKVAIMFEECGLDYRTIPVNTGKGDQFKPEFLAISPNRMPAIVDHDNPDGPLPVFESGAILLHLGRTCRTLHAADPAGSQGMPRMAVLARRQSRADGRPAQPFRQLRRGRTPLLAPALCGRI